MNIRYRLKGAWDVLVKGEKVAYRRKSIPAITTEEIAEIKQFFPMPKFFVLGHSRSGNTMLMRLVRQHPEVHCNYQATFFSLPPGLKSLVDKVEIERWLSQKSNHWNHGRDLSPLVMRAAADFIMENDARKNGKRIVGDKSPTTVTHGAAVRNMFQVYPDASMVYIVRDGRDVMVSDRFRNLVEKKWLRPGDEQIIAELQQHPERFTSGEKSIFTESWLRDRNQGVVTWADNLNESHAEGTRLYGDRYYRVKYEDILADPFETMKKIWLFLGVSEVGDDLAEALQKEVSINPDEKWQAEKDGNLAPTLEKGKPGAWKKFFSDKDKAIFKEIAGQQLIDWGYEKDINW